MLFFQTRHKTDRTLYNPSKQKSRVWSAMFTAGVPYKAVVAVFICITVIPWLRTVFLMPSGWINETNFNLNVFHLSPYKTRKLFYTGGDPKTQFQTETREYFKRAIQHAFSLKYAFFVIWAVISRVRQKVNYKGHFSKVSFFVEPWL